MTTSESTNSAFLLDVGPWAGGSGVSVWDCGSYIRLDNLDEGLQAGGDVTHPRRGLGLRVLPARHVSGGA